ncbi:MAG: hypothetical protein AB1394_07205 [Bacteroidota bacterium]
MRNKILLLTFFLLQNVLLASGGSVYTRIGLGELTYNFSARRFALGELGFSIADRDYLSYTNPASWNQLLLTRFETGFMVNSVKQTTAAASVFNSNSYYTGLMFGFPIDRKNGISFAAGIVPYSNVAYELIASESNPLVDPHKTTYKGDGGIFKLFFGTSYRLPFGLSLGASFDYFNGKINNTTSVAFGDTSTFHNATFLREFSYHGIGATFGMISNDLSSLFGENVFKDFRIGLSYSPQINLSSDTTITFSSLVGDSEFKSGALKTKLPHRLGIGASFKITDNYLFTLDYMTQSMSRLEWGSEKSSQLQDISKYSFGVEYTPSYDAVGFLKQLSLRGGISYEKTPYVFGGTTIDQLSIYCGLSIPLKFEYSFNSLDIGFQYGRRGTTENKLIREDLFKVNFSLSFGELWFIQSER